MTNHAAPDQPLSFSFTNKRRISESAAVAGDSSIEKKSLVGSEGAEAAGLKQYKELTRNLENEVKEIKKELQEQKDAFELKKKLLAKAEVDLADLRKRYSEKVKQKEVLEEIVVELYEKLEVAVALYDQVELSHPELIGKLHTQSYEKS